MVCLPASFRSFLASVRFFSHSLRMRSQRVPFVGWKTTTILLLNSSSEQKWKKTGYTICNSSCWLGGLLAFFASLVRLFLRTIFESSFTFGTILKFHRNVDCIVRVNVQLQMYRYVAVHLHAYINLYSWHMSSLLYYDTIHVK